MSAKQTPKVELDGEALVITVPMTLRRRSGRKEVHVPLGLPRAGKAKEKTSALALAVARAYRWQEQLEAGEYRSTTELAEALGVDRAYVSRMLRLTSLAPALVERIVFGDEPEGLTLAGLMRGLPMVWSDRNEKSAETLGEAPRPSRCAGASLIAIGWRSRTGVGIAHLISPPCLRRLLERKCSQITRWPMPTFFSSPKPLDHPPCEE